MPIALKSIERTALFEPRQVSDIHATRVLSLDSSGRILDWISWQDAVCLYVRDAVSWTLGAPCLTIHGGTSRLTGEQSTLALHPIVASRGHARLHAVDPAPALTPGLQYPQRQPYPAAGGHALARRAVSTELGRASDSVQSKYPGRSDGIPHQSPAEEPAQRLIRQRLDLALE
jgi:hypothetical protein